ncbi:MAG: hypothetical protein GXP21_00660, partial [Gammaproteobacteria bacterium]|nr:hypothetical protein [Gammaproteobacteria bacterium]
MAEQTLVIQAIATDSVGNTGESNSVRVILGFDEEQPVINLVSPVFTATDSGDDIAEVVELSEIVLRVTGFDNVGVERLELYGVRREGAGFVLSGDINDVLTDADFAPQQVPGVVNAYSAFRLVSVPEFSGIEGLEFDRYPIRVSAFDEVGNSSTLNAVIGVTDDQVPVVFDVLPDQPSYFTRDTVGVDIAARDDRAVESLIVDYRIGAQVLRSITVNRDSEDFNFNPLEVVQITDAFDLTSFNLSNVDQEILVEVRATDNRGQQSLLNTQTIAINEDNTAPLAAITSPPQGSVLYSTDQVDFSWRGLDETALATIQITTGSETVVNETLSSKRADGRFVFTIPQDSGEGLVFRITVSDVFGASTETLWRYDILDNQAPLISFRTPPAGSRLVEGEAFTVNASVSDDQGIDLVEIFIDSAGDRQIIESFSAGQANEIIEDGGFFRASSRVPNKINDTDPRVGVRAVDNSGAITELFLDWIVLDDEEAPVVSNSEPNESFSVLPTDTFNVVGTASDNRYINTITPILIDNEGNEAVFEWEVFGRTDRIERITAPNPSSFGNSLIAERFFVDFDGRIRVPISFLDRAGEVFDFIIRVEDNGINRGETDPIQVTILADEEAPVISITAPEQELVDRQAAELLATLTDNIRVASYEVSVIDADGIRVLESKTDINQEQAQVRLDLDLSAYAPVIEPVTVTFSITATDIVGNSATENLAVNIVVDEAPTITLQEETPGDPQTKGSIGFHRFNVEDDYTDNDDFLNAGIIYSSLSGERNVVGISAVSAVENEIRRDRIEFDYPEAIGTTGVLRINNENRYTFSNGVMSVSDIVSPDLFPPQVETIELDFSGVSVDYRLRSFDTGVCGGEPVDLIVTAQELLSSNGVLRLLDYIPSAAAHVIIEPIFNSIDATVLPAYIDHIEINFARLPSNLRFTTGEEAQARRFDRYDAIQLFVNDNNAGQLAFVQSNNISQMGSDEFISNRFLAGFVEPDISSYSIYGYASDRFSTLRGPTLLTSLTNTPFVLDTETPTVSISSPIDGTIVHVGETVAIDVEVSDNTNQVTTVSLRDNNGVVIEQGGVWNQDSYSFRYQVPENAVGSELEFTAIVEDLSGRTQSSTILLPVEVNLVPEIELDRFSSFRLNGRFQRNIVEADRLNFAEFRVRIGEEFQLATNLADDIGLQSYRLYRLQRDGSKVLEDEITYSTACPALPITRAPSQTSTVRFQETEPTEYEIVIEDLNGLIAVRTILVIPLTNITPEIRVTVPAEGQFIVAGTFNIEVGVVAADDRTLSNNSIRLFANGIELAATNASADSPGGLSIVNQAFDSIFDDFERNYTIDVAEQHGRVDSPNSLFYSATYAVPSGLIRFNEDITLTAQIEDVDGARAVDTITFIGAADDINPEIAVVSPNVGFGPPEFSDFDFDFRGFDNVKVNQLQLFRTYAVQIPGGEYQRLDFGTPIRTINGIPDADVVPVTTNNIDTPLYRQLVNVDRLTDIIDLFPNIALTQGTRFDIWLRVVATDPSGNVRIREVSYPVRIDQRPVIDIIEPINGSRQVESTTLFVNTRAFDDVGIDSVTLVATQGTQSPVELVNLTLRQAPYAFGVPLPAFDPDNPDNNIITLQMDAIDTFGAAFGDLDAHLASETISIEIVEDVPPVIAIGTPEDGDTVIEGEFMLVQVNALDDAGIDRVILNVSGLIEGDRSFTDTAFPYEFFVEIPFGQGGRSLQLTASATEQRTSGEPRTVQTPRITTVNVERDTDAPVIAIRLPESSGTAIAEGRSLPYDLNVTDNVRVISVRAELFADQNLDSVFQDDERIRSALLLASPYSGNLTVDSLSEYLGEDSTVNQLDLQFRVTAIDGAGNTSITEVPAVLIENQPPSIDQIQILDERGFNFGDSLTEITEGRGIVVSVIASDPEIGISSVSLNQALGIDPDTLTFQPLTTDVAAPYQFQIDVPVGAVGSTISFNATAIDVDGRTSAVSAPRSLTIIADQPPTAVITQPFNDESVIIDGQDIEVFVDVFDDLGNRGIDRVVFYVNGNQVFTAFEPISTDIVGATAADNIYRALIEPPTGVDGFSIQATAFDIRGQSGQSQVIQVGRIDDTVEPDLDLFLPFNNEILTTAEPLIVAAAIEDIGNESERFVFVNFIREHQNEAGEWVTLNTSEIQLFRDDADTRPDILASDADNHLFVYWAEFADGNILQRGAFENERVRAISRVTTPEHNVELETTYEVGLPVAERRFFSPSQGQNNVARSVFYTSVAQFNTLERDNALVAAWATTAPVAQEPGIATRRAPNLLEPVMTGLFLADFASEQDDDGDVFIFSDLLNGASEIFAGSISEIHADPNFVLASKNGLDELLEFDPIGLAPFVASLFNEINRDPETGMTYFDNTSAELLIFTNQSGEGQFGLPYLLAGRIDLPFPDTYGLTRRDDLAFVANGDGGIQVIDISNLNAPYRVGFIRPNGFSRDVKISGDYAFIAASNEGVVIADITNPSLPIVATLDTLGIANRLQIVGNTLYVTDMSGEGRVSQLNIIDIADPQQPRLLRTVSLTPAREDFVSRGVYDVHVTGNQAYLSVHYSDQEDVAAQAVVEVLDLEKLDTPQYDPTIPAVIHRQVVDDDFILRDITLARNGIQVAAGKAGINRIELSQLTVLDHSPAVDENFVVTDIDRFLIELSAVLPPNADLVSAVRVFAGELLIDSAGDFALAEEVSADFSVAFATRNDDDARSFLEIIPSQELTANTQYSVVVNAGLQPLAGNPLARDYVFSFFTSPAGSIVAPDITAISPATGGIDGSTRVMLRGQGFGDNPQVFIGGQRLVIDEYVPASVEGEDDQVIVTTIPNNAGPASVEIRTETGLRDIVIGGFAYVDLLQLSFVDPAVVSISQAGRNDIVDVVGLGFHPDISLISYPTGEPDRAVTQLVDQDRLRLESSSRLVWSVPEFGEDFRGFIDLEIVDEVGRHDILPRAIFFGRLGASRVLENEVTLASIEINAALRAIELGLPSPLTRDPGKLPPGKIVSLASDPELGYIYVLSRATRNSARPGFAIDNVTFTNFIQPSTLTLVHYERDQLENAAPLLGLGYFDLPQDLNASAIVLGNENLYVSARGMNFPSIRTEHENQTWLLVYDREDRLPGQGGPEQTEGRDRDILYKLPIPLNQPPRKMLVKDGLMVLDGRDQGVLVMSIADPLRPTIIGRIENGLASGVPVELNVSDFSIVDSELTIVSLRDNNSDRFVFDLSLPSLPQTGHQLLQLGIVPIIHSASEQKQALIQLGFQGSLGLYDSQTPSNAFLRGRYETNGFPLPGTVPGLLGLHSAATTSVTYGNESCFPEARGFRFFVNILDISRDDNVSVLDASEVAPCESGSTVIGLEDYSNERAPSIYTDDGLVILSSNNAANEEQAISQGADFEIVTDLRIVDTFVQDLVESYPGQGGVGVAVNAVIVLDFTLPVSIPGSEQANSYLSRYLALLYEDGSATGQAVEFSVEIDSTDSSKILITPNQNLPSNSNFRLDLFAEPSDGGRRVIGFFDHTIRFSTGSSQAAPLQIVSIIPATVQITGGEITVDVINANDPIFLISGDPANIESAETLTSGAIRYVLRIPSQLVGPATLRIEESDGRQLERIGAVQYVEPLIIESIAPAQGSINGGASVTITGRGFAGGDLTTEIFVGRNPVSSEDIRIIDTNTITIVTPPGPLGTADIEVRISSGQRGLLDYAFEYQQPVVQNIADPSVARYYDLVLDPTQTFMVAAAGRDGVILYNLDPSVFVADVNDPANAEDLLEFIDRDGDGSDDRIVSRIPLPGGYAALGVELFFERNNDRIFVTASRLNGNGLDARLFIIAIDNNDLSNSTVIRSLPLHSRFARGIVAENNRAVIAMAEKGIGFVDTFFHTKFYLSEFHVLPNALPALDVDKLATVVGQTEKYVVVGGEFDLNSNKLLSAEAAGAGGFHIIERDPSVGLRTLASLDIPASRVKVVEGYAYLAAGDAGLVIVDVRDSANPTIVSRVNNVGRVYDIDVNGSTVYLARGDAGILTVDVTNPNRPVVVEGIEAFDGNFIDVIIATDFSAVGAGIDGLNRGVVQVAPDVVLRLNRIDPINGILDLDALGNLQIRLRFNQAIDLNNENNQFFEVLNSAGDLLNFDLEIINNDAIIT